MAFQLFKKNGFGNKTEYTVAELSDIPPGTVSSDARNLMTVGSDGGFYIEQPVVFSSKPISTMNTTAAYEPKVTGTTPPLAGGKYLIEVSYGWSSNSTSRDFLGQFKVDGTPETVHAFMHREEARDAAGTNVGGTGTDQAHGFSARFEKTFAIGATPVILLEYRTQLNGITVGIWDAMITLTRVEPL